MTWKASNDTIPTAIDKKLGLTYVCIICGLQSVKRDEIITHLAGHPFKILQRFNLDTIFQNNPECAKTTASIQCLHDPTCKFDIDDLGQHRCRKNHCGSLDARLMHRIHEFELDSGNGWDTDKTAMRTV